MPAVCLLSTSLPLTTALLSFVQLLAFVLSVPVAIPSKCRTKSLAVSVLPAPDSPEMMQHWPANAHGPPSTCTFAQTRQHKRKGAGVYCASASREGADRIALSFLNPLLLRVDGEASNQRPLETVHAFRQVDRCAILLAPLAPYECPVRHQGSTKHVWVWFGPSASTLRNEVLLHGGRVNGIERPGGTD